MDIVLSRPQLEMYKMADRRVPFPLFIGGFGSGKSYSLIVNAFRDVTSFKGCRVGIYAPNYDQIILNLMPRFEEFLTEMGIKYSVNRGNYTISFYRNQYRFIFRSISKPERIVGYEVYRSHVDEIDTLPDLEKCSEAWDKIRARTRMNHPDRKKSFNQVCAYTTPEGYHFTYNKWKRNENINYKYVRAETSSNPFVSEEYVKTMLADYTPEQVQAYCFGYWCNMKSGSVYSYFDRRKLHSDRLIQENDILYIGVDFNYGGSRIAVFVKDNNDPIMVAEHSVIDTEKMAELIKEKYVDHGHKVYVYPDATGKKKTTNASESDIEILKKAKLKIRAKDSNPRVEDRVNSANALMYRERFKINTHTCPETTEAFEQQAYDKQGKPEKHNGPNTVDDIIDAATYFIAYDYPIKKRRVKVKKVSGF